VLKRAKTSTGGSDKPIIHYRAGGYALADVAMPSRRATADRFLECMT
jgi:hypothetical protein